MRMVFDFLKKTPEGSSRLRYEVRWSVYSDYGVRIPHVVLFDTPEEADDFMMDLRKAMLLLRGDFRSVPEVRKVGRNPS